MKQKIFTLTLCVLISLSFTLLSGCERMSNIIGPTDTTMLTLKVGVIQPLEYYAGYSLGFPPPHEIYASFAKGAELARDELNQSGGVLNMQIEFIYKYNQNDPDVFPDLETSVQVAKELVEDENVIALLDPIFLTNAVQDAKIIEKPIFTTLSALSGIAFNEYNDSLFLVAGSSNLQPQHLAQFVKNKLFVERATIIYQADNFDSMDFTEGFRTVFQNLGGVISTDVYVNGQTNFRDEIRRIEIRWRERHVLLLPSFGSEISLLMEQILENNFYDCGYCTRGLPADGSGVCPSDCANVPPPLLWTDFSWGENSEVLDSLGGSHYIANFYKSMNAPDSAQLNDIAESGYYAVKHLALAIEKAQSVEPVAVRNALANIESVAQIIMFKQDDFK